MQALFILLLIWGFYFSDAYNVRRNMIISNKDKSKIDVYDDELCSGRLKTTISNLCTSTQIMYMK